MLGILTPSQHTNMTWLIYSSRLIKHQEGSFGVCRGGPFDHFDLHSIGVTHEV